MATIIVSITIFIMFIIACYVIIKDTKLEKLYKEGLYKPLSLDEAIEISSRLYMIYSYKKFP